MTDTLTHAITVPQPLAWAVAAGHCPVIMSDTRPFIAREGELIGIHAAHHQRPASEIIERAQVKIAMGDPQAQPVKFTYGALIGVARLVGVVRVEVGGVGDGWIPGQLRIIGFERMLGASVASRLTPEDSDRIRPWWRSGSKWGLLLEDAVLLPEPIPMRGAGGVWRIPDSLRIDAGGTAYDSGPAAWALEQWRKARTR